MFFYVKYYNTGRYFTPTEKDILNIGLACIVTTVTDDISEKDITCEVEEDYHNFMRNNIFNDNPVRMSNLILIKKGEKIQADVSELSFFLLFFT